METVINKPEAFKVCMRVGRGNQQVTEWIPMRKGVANLFRYRDVSLAANARYLEALAVVDDPGKALKQMHMITRPKRNRAGQSVRAFNPLSDEDQRFSSHCCREQTPLMASAIGIFDYAWQTVPSCVLVGAVYASNQRRYLDY